MRREVREHARSRTCICLNEYSSGITCYEPYTACAHVRFPCVWLPQYFSNLKRTFLRGLGRMFILFLILATGNSSSNRCFYCTYDIVLCKFACASGCYKYIHIYIHRYTYLHFILHFLIRLILILAYQSAPSYIHLSKANISLTPVTPKL